MSSKDGTKIRKKEAKAFQKALKKEMKYSDSLGLKELGSEVSDVLTGKKREKQKVKFGERLVSPAYVFAKRVESLIHIIVGISVVVSAIIAVIWGVSKMSDLLGILITSWWGRIILGVIGLAYLTMGAYTLFYKD